MIIFRDDDSPLHGLTHFIPVHEILKKYNLVHTVALVCRNLDRQYDFIEYVKSDIKNFDLQFHCLDHIDYSDERNRDILDQQFGEGRQIMLRVFGVTPDTWYPCWNKSDEYSERKALVYGMKTNPVKFSFGQVKRNSETIKKEGGVINLHHWCKEERDQLEEIIKLVI